MNAALCVLLAQQLAISGIVHDSVRSEPVAAADIVAIDARGRSLHGRSDEHGAFIIAGLGPGPIRLRVDALGYARWEATTSGEHLPLSVRLRPDPVAIAPLDVTGRQDTDPLSLRGDRFRVDSATIARLPKVLETDVLRAVTLTPLAASNSDYSSVPFIRDGTAEGTPILLDGVRLFNPFHLAGFLSAVNAEVVNQVEVLSSGGGAAVEQGSISGALQLSTRDGARDRIHTAGAVGLASSRLSVEGPLGPSGSFVLDGRRTYLDLFTDGLHRFGVIEQPLPYRFSDVHAKVTQALGGLSRISLTAYWNGESLDDLDRTDHSDVGSRWSNSAISLHYRTGVGASGLLDVTAGRSAFRSRGHGEEEGDLLLDADASMGETRLDARLEWHRRALALEIGSQLSRFSSDFRSTVPDASIQDVLPNLALAGTRGRYAAYGQLRFAPAPRSSVGVGSRLDYFPGLGTTISPSLSFGTGAGPVELRLEASQSSQDLYSLRNEESLYDSFIAYDLLLPAATGPLLRNREVDADLQWAAGNARFRLGLYTRWLAGLRLPALGEYPLDGTALVQPETQQLGTGRGHGIELSGSWRRGPLSLVGAYRGSRALRTVAGETYVPRFHRDHSLQVGAFLSRGTGGFSARLSLQSGQPYTPIEAVVPIMVEGFGGFLVSGGRYNSARLPPYARLDLGWQTERHVSVFGRRGTAAPYIALLNALNGKNVVSTKLDDESFRPALQYLPQLPLLPFFGLEFRF